MKKIIIILIHCYLINIYNSNENILGNKSNISIYYLNGIYDLNQNNTLNKIMILKEKTNQKHLRDLWNLSSLLLSNILDQDTKSQKNYILDIKSNESFSYHRGPSGFLANTIFLQLHKTCLPNPIKIFATGAYDYPEFDKTLDSILKQKEFINENIKESSLENNDDVSINKNTLYYNPYLINKIIPELEKQFTEEKNKNIPIQFIGGIAIKLLNWLAHCHEEKTFESIVFLPKKMEDNCNAILECLNNINIIKSGNFIYVQDTNEIKEYCKMIQNETLNQKISINQNIQFDSAKTISKISLALINHYYNKIKNQNFSNKTISQIDLLESTLSGIANTLPFPNAFTKKERIVIFNKLLDILKTNIVQHEYIENNFFINFLYNIIINESIIIDDIDNESDSSSSNKSNQDIVYEIDKHKEFPFILLHCSPFTSSTLKKTDRHAHYITDYNKNTYNDFFDKLINKEEFSREEKLYSLAKKALYFVRAKSETAINNPPLSQTIDFIASYAEKLLPETTNDQLINKMKEITLSLKKNTITRQTWTNRFITWTCCNKENAYIKEIKNILKTDINIITPKTKQYLFKYYNQYKNKEITIYDFNKIYTIIIEQDIKNNNKNDSDIDYNNLELQIQASLKKESSNCCIM